MHTGFDRFMAMPRSEIDLQLSPSKSAKDAQASLGAMVTDTAAASRNPVMTLRQNIPYGVRPRQQLDVFSPNLAGAGLCPAVIFLHGGFWQEGDKSVSGFAAVPFASMGWATVAVGYTLTPDVTLTQLTQEIHEAVQYVASQARSWGIDPARLVLAGHSAGGHLAATVICDLLHTDSQRLICGAVLVSGVFELAPVARSYVNDVARMTTPEIGALSPLRHPPKVDIPVHILIGSDEPEAFQAQSAILNEVWQTKLSVITMTIAAKRDHFDVLEELQDIRSPTVKAIARMIRPVTETD